MAKEKSGATLARAIGMYHEEIVIGDETISLSPLVLRQFADVLECIDELRERGVVEVKDLTGNVLQNVDPIKIMLRGGDPALRMLQIATARPTEWINKLNLVDAAKLFGGVFKVNYDFFFDHKDALMEALSMILPTIKEVMSGTEQSTASSQPDISSQS